ncbi:thymidylate kinase [Bacteroidia bacterium]|nr:thymidylate kinase [Bacteroidia bacterium]
MLNFIVIEGIDGAGKSTQMRLLAEYMQKQGRQVRSMHFPRVETGTFGNLIAQFLRGDFGKINEVHPYLVALLFAEDRRDAASTLQKWIDEGCFVMVDRYVYSNVAFQGAKMSNEADRRALREWVMRLEYEEFGIPQPQLSLFLDVPFSFTQQVLQQQRQGDDRSYLQGKQDIHEADLKFQQAVRQVYLEQAALDKSFRVVSCMDEQAQKMMPCEQLFDKIKDIVDAS